MMERSKRLIRELKCPYGDDFEGGDECNRCEQYELCIESYPSVNLIKIPNGATNGDVVKKIFGDVYCILIRMMYSSCCEKLKNWWNAPYKGDLK